MSNRAGRRTSRSRRTPQKPSGGAGSQIPWMPIGAAVGAVAVIAVVVFVIIQSGGSSDSNEDVVAAEAYTGTDVPGEFVDLAEIYGGAYPETAGHVSRDVDYDGDGNSNPPVGGPHWSGGGCEDPASAAPFCGPAAWGIYRDPYQPETLVHNMEHGGVVVWYNFDDTALRDELEGVVEDTLDDGHLVVMSPYDDMEPDTIAITSWSRIEKFPASEFTAERVETFINVNDRRFNPENF